MCPRGAEIDTSLSMLELGVKSLDAVEINYRVMREFGIRLSQKELVQSRSIDEIVALVETHMDGNGS
jgi:acyl carrier protein